MCPLKAPASQSLPLVFVTLFPCPVPELSSSPGCVPPPSGQSCQVPPGWSGQPSANEVPNAGEENSWGKKQAAGPFWGVNRSTGQGVVPGIWKGSS